VIHSYRYESAHYRRTLLDMINFWKDETGFDSGNKLPPHMAKYALAFLVLNEIRGLMVAVPIALQIWG